MNGPGQDVFRQEAQELLEELEQALMDLEGQPDDLDTVGRVFRAMHTLKGSGAMFGFENIAGFVHDVETLYDQIRNGTVEVSSAIIENSLRARDQIGQMLEDSSLGPSSPEVQDLTAFFKSAHAGADAVGTPGQQPQMEVRPRPEDEIRTYRIQFKPHPDLFLKGTNPELLLSELRAMGNCSVAAYTQAGPFLEDFDVERCYTSWDVFLTTDAGEDAIRDVFIFAEDDCDLAIESIDDAFSPENAETKKIGDILVERGFATKEQIESAISKRKLIGEFLVDGGVVTSEHVESALVEQQHLKEVQGRKVAAESAATIKVSSEKLDALVDLVGELVTVHARLNQTAYFYNNQDIIRIAEELERLVWDLRDNTMSVRMLPIGATFSKFKRLVRDLSKSLGKEIELVTSGADTELDKTVIEKLNDPMVHLIRNSVDHGIESPDAREARGKKRTGTIHLSARHSGANVLIEIADDGGGLDPEVIRTKAAEKGLISPDAELKDDEIFELILLPGFSTAQNVSNVSGRGVGMDVVKKNVEALRGSINIESQKGAGTTITLKLPLTLAIIDGLLIRISDQFFVVPLTFVEECIELTRQDISKTHGRDIIKVRGEIVPYVSVRRLFGIQGNVPDVQQVVITSIDNKRVGFVVDAVIGDHQTVIKSLGTTFKDVCGVSGATILGDGSIALIMDIAKIFHGFNESSQSIDRRVAC